MLNYLTRLVPPPLYPSHAYGDWTKVERNLGFELPLDYKQIIETYGYGQFCDDLSLINPFAGKPFASNAVAIILQWQQISDLCADEYAFFPAPGGLLPCAVNINGHFVSWKTEGDSSAWDILIWDSSEPNYIVLKSTSLASLLHDILSHSSPLTKLLLPDLASDSNRNPWFTQWEFDASAGQPKPMPMPSTH